MSLIPFFLDDFLTQRPARLLDQHFGMALDPEDLLKPFTIPQEVKGFIRMPSSGYYHPWRSQQAQNDGRSEISVSGDKFQVNLDVQHFNPEEISVKTTGDNTITVEAKHEEKRDAHGFISRQFVRKYVLPEGHDIQNIQSKLSSDGVLTITAPKINVQGIENRSIPIQQTGMPSKSIENKKTQDKN